MPCGNDFINENDIPKEVRAQQETDPRERLMDLQSRIAGEKVTPRGESTPAASSPGVFRMELGQLINRHSRENGSNTPDFILAQYLTDSLAAFDRAVNARTAFFN